MKTIETIDFWDMPEDYPLYKEVKRILIRRAQNPDKNSIFIDRGGKHSDLSGNKLLNALKGENYNALIQYEESSVYPYSFFTYFAFQRGTDERGNPSVSIFEIQTKKQRYLENRAKEEGIIFRVINRSNLRECAKQWVDYAREKGIKRIRGDRQSTQLLRILKKMGLEKELKIQVTPEKKLVYVPKLPKSPLPPGLRTGRF